MRKLLLIGVCLLAGMHFCLAAVVPQERAAAVAASFFSREGVATKSTAQPSVRLVACFPDVPTKSASTAPLLYVYERETDGFVLVAGDDAARPVLGYSMNGHFPTREQMPVNLKDMLDWYSAVVYRARVMGWKPSDSIRNQWEQTASASPSSSPVKLTTAEWNQGSPYNNLCPRVDGEECPCGCVATAMAIIMRYHSWPKQGSGTLPSYDFGWDYYRNTYKGHVDGFDLGHTYEWDKMSLSGSFSQEGAAQVARLCYDLGVMSQMEYAPDGSGAASDSPIQMARYFGYDKQLRYYDREYFSDERWEELIRDEIDAGRPVFHCGFSSDGGHAFVLDGYNDRYFSINYGWGGSANAYYTMTPIDGHREDLTEFNRMQDMVCRIMPDQGGLPYVNLFVSGGRASFDWDFRSPSFKTGELYLYKTNSTGDGPTELCYCLYSADGKLREALSDPFIVDSSDMPLLVSSVECRAPSQVEDGDRIMLSRRDDKYQWSPLQQDRIYYVQFDGRHPLSQLVSLGHAFDSPSQWNLAGPSCLFLQAYKDMYWELRSAADDRIMLTSGSSTGNYVFNKAYTRYEVQSLFSAGKRDYSYFSFLSLPPGEYRLLVRNFDEEMTLTVVL